MFLYSGLKPVRHLSNSVADFYIERIHTHTQLIWLQYFPQVLMYTHRISVIEIAPNFYPKPISFRSYTEFLLHIRALKRPWKHNNYKNQQINFNSDENAQIINNPAAWDIPHQKMIFHSFHQLEVHLKLGRQGRLLQHHSKKFQTHLAVYWQGNFY